MKGINPYEFSPDMMILVVGLALTILLCVYQSVSTDTVEAVTSQESEAESTEFVADYSYTYDVQHVGNRYITTVLEFTPKSNSGMTCVAQVGSGSHSLQCFPKGKANDQ